MPKYRKKLIEVDLPLTDINAHSAREKQIRQGHPSTLHQWWARRPLASCRAVIFASMVDDPSSCPDEFPTIEDQVIERKRLHGIISRLIKWKDSNNPDLLAEARLEIAKSIARQPDKPPIPDNHAPTVLQYLAEHAPTIYDPFCGGGSIPLETQRLGMKAVGSDLNPVAVLITKALIEIPPKFANKPPVNPDADPMGMTAGKGSKAQKVPWRGAAGLADDIRYYGKWMRDEAFKRIGHLYPTIKDENGIDRTVIAWLWCRTIPCSNPACGINMPMMKTFQLSKKANNRHWTKPEIDRETNTISFKVQNHPTDVPTEATVDRYGATCIACNTSAKLDYVRQQARESKIGEQMTAIIAKGDRKRLFISPTDEHVQTALSAEPEWRPNQTMPDDPTLVSGRGYNVTHWHQLFTERQLMTLTTFSDLISEVRSLIVQDSADEEYADAVCTYLAFILTKTSVRNCSYNVWDNTKEIVAGVFGRQAIPMIWDYAESNAFSISNGSFTIAVEGVAKNLEQLPSDINIGKTYQADASTTVHANDGPVIVTDPPYYDNISYATLSDFFYVWLRPALRDTYPELFAGMLTPKVEEMIADRRFEDPRQHFEEGLNQTLKLVRRLCTDDYPSSIFYAYKQQEEDRGGKTSTGWETMLNALIDSGFHITGTWPMRTELPSRLNSLGSNALATSVVIVCRPRPEDAPIATRSQFLSKLKQELPAALDKLTSGTHIDPVDMPQATFGPGMGIYSQYSQVIRNNGQPVPVREALKEINNAVATYLDEQQGSLDNETRLCFDWLRQHGSEKGRYGDVETMARASNLAISTVNDIQHLMTAQGGTVQLNPIQHFNPDLKSSDRDTTAWEGCMRMAWHFSQEDGKRIPGAAEVAANMLNGNTDNVETLARILYDHYDRKNQPSNALIYNTLVHNMPEIRSMAAEMQRANQAAII